MSTAKGKPAWHRLKDPSAQKVLADRERLAAMYEEMGSCWRVAEAINCGGQAVLTALHWHQIPVQKRGGYNRRTPTRITRATLRQIVQRAYLKAGRCPPNCPGRAHCLEHGCTEV